MRREETKKDRMAVFLFARVCDAHEPGSHQPAAANACGATYPRFEEPFIGACPTIHSIGGFQK
jgi:hypothetical protein